MACRGQASVLEANRLKRIQVDTSLSSDQITHFFDIVVGMSFKNRDGSDRLQAALECAPDEQLDLIAEPDNPADPNAIAVCRRNGQQIGYLPRELAAIVSKEMARHWEYPAFVWTLGDDTPPYTAFSIELLIFRVAEGKPEEEVQSYIDGISDWSSTTIRPYLATAAPHVPADCAPKPQAVCWPQGAPGAAGPISRAMC